MSPDPIIPDYFKPQSLNRYSYANNNPVNRTDPSGMCAEFGDDACWNMYERIIRLCPECATMTRPTLAGDRKLHQENIYYLQTVLEHIQARLRSPKLPTVPKLPTGTLPSTCGSVKPCIVLVGANRVAFFAEPLRDTPLLPLAPYHTYILIVDPNREMRLGSGSFPSDTPAPAFSGDTDINGEVTVYDFWAGNESFYTNPETSFASSKLDTWYGYYRGGRRAAPDWVGNRDFLGAIYEVRENNANCEEIFRCLKKAYDLVKDMGYTYNFGGRNSNATVYSALRRCGLSLTTPPGNVWAPGWGFDLFAPQVPSKPPTPPLSGTPIPNGL
ncbi:MAG: hypothetical protein HYR94_27455 [Chloroflexi bacterium]|nr:hypothetical protein [Chloroflexota bacterium]